MRANLDVEVWACPNGFEGRYEVSSFGAVRSLLSARGTPWNDGPLLMSFKPHEGGYCRVSLRKKDHYVHRLVLETFQGECPDGYQCAHLDGNPKNNKLSNLKWVSPLENMSHRVAHGTALSLDVHPMSKLNSSVVLTIRKEFSMGISQRDLAKKYGVTQSCISLANSGKNWGSVF
jgi:hypothetical protein